MKVKKKVLITGASRGIGRAIAQALSPEWTPLIGYRQSKEEAVRVAEEVGGLACPFGADLSSPGGCDSLWGWASSVGPVAGLVNNAGIYRPMPLCGADDVEFEAAWTEHLSLNLMATARLTRRFVMEAEQGAKVLNVCSRVGFRGEPSASAYAASKAAQINLVRSLAIELAPRGIGVFGIAPGWVETAMTREGMDTRRQEIVAGIPLGRVASTRDCGAVAAFLLSDHAEYLSGVVIDINGASYFH